MYLLTTKETMNYLHVGKDLLRAFREYKLLNMWKVSREYRTTLEDIDDFIELTRGYDLTCEADVRTFARTHKLI